MSELIRVKYCKRCDRWLEATTENFYPNGKKKNGEVRFRTLCKTCHDEHMNEYKQTEKGKETDKKANNKWHKNNPEYMKQWWDNYLEENGLERGEGSQGEQKVRQVLRESKITFSEQHRFDDCRLHRPLPFDFYIPSLNIAIEYDGHQHFNIIEQFGGLDGFIDTIIRDTIKNDYCRRNNIRLIRIPYWEFDNIEQILSDLL